MKTETLALDEDSQNQISDITNTEDRTTKTFEEEETKEYSTLDSKTHLSSSRARTFFCIKHSDHTKNFV